MEPAEALADCLRGVAETLRHHRDLGFREITLSRDPFSEPVFPDPRLSDSGLSDFRTSDPTDALRVQEQARAGCKLCKLCKSRSTIVFGVGNPRARLMVVGEGPGEEEDKQGIPFVGRAGQLLTKMLAAYSWLGTSAGEYPTCLTRSQQCYSGRRKRCYKIDILVAAG
jgi:hypothetical protein